MNEFAAAEWFEMEDRGWVAVVAGIDGFNPRPLIGQQVHIDGKAYTIKGVETYAIPDPTGCPFGLLVGER